MIKSWNEMPIGVFQKMYYINGLHVDDAEKTFRITALLAGIEYEKFIEMPLVDSKELIAQSSFLLEEPRKVKTRKTYKIGTRTYRLMRNMDDLSVAQYINYQAIANRPIQETLPDLMSLVLIPDGEEYGKTNNDEIVNEIRDYLNVEEALSIASFFTKLFEKSIRRMLWQSDIMMRAAKITAKKEDREMIEAMQIQMKLITDELRSEFGFR